MVAINEMDAYPEQDLDVEVPPAAQVLEECIKLMIKKNRDYNNPNSSVLQAQHYRRGIDTIHDMLHQKLLRAQSLIEAQVQPSNESLVDTYKDIINYAAFAVLYLRYEMPGQQTNRDMFNRPKIQYVSEKLEGTTHG